MLFFLTGAALSENLPLCFERDDILLCDVTLFADVASIHNKIYLWPKQQNLHERQALQTLQLFSF